MKSALIGFSGFVGSTLLRQTQFTHLYRANNIQTIEGQSFDTVVCAGAPAQKWIANRDPKTDLQKIEMLMTSLKDVRCKKFVLISTVDVFKNSVGANEDTVIDEVGLHPYGLHRRLLEKFVESHFPEAAIVRLPGLVGPGLRKNILFDALNNNNLAAIDSRSVFQFYPMVNLWCDLQNAMAANLRYIHLTAEPIRVMDVFQFGFGRTFDQTLEGTPANYDMRTRYATIFGGSGDYQYSIRETLLAIRTYAQSEPQSKY
jgi:nucleoside-diphosphate-sugar epimerase